MTGGSFNSFLGSGGTEEDAPISAVVLPAPLENTSSYPVGTAAGPRAFLRASAHIEGYDPATGSDLAGLGVETRAPLALAGLRNEEALKLIETEVARILGEGLWPLVVGGERTLSVASAQALKARSPEAGVIVFAGEAALKAKHEGGDLHRACAWRRVHELGLPLALVGVRSSSRVEADFARASKIEWIELAEASEADFDLGSRLADFPDEVLVVFDLGALAPGEAPGSGTLEPGGLSWARAARLVDQLFRSKEVSGADIVELYPVAGSVQTETLAARLACRMLSLRF